MRLGRFIGILGELVVRGWITRHNIRAAWIQSKRGWQETVSAVELTDDEFAAWLDAMEIEP